MQNASGVLYRPTAGPKERALALAHKLRTEALSGRGEDRPIIKPAPAPVAVEAQSPPAQPEADPIAEWVKRQRELFPPMPLKPLWFSIVDEVEPREPRRPTVAFIQRVVAQYYGFTRTDIMSRRRNAHVVRARQVSMYLVKRLTLKSLPEIGRRFGGKDHTTVLHAVRKIEHLKTRDEVLADDIIHLLSVIGGADERREEA